MRLDESKIPFVRHTVRLGVKVSWS